MNDCFNVRSFYRTCFGLKTRESRSLVSVFSVTVSIRANNRLKIQILNESDLSLSLLDQIK